MGGPIGSGAVMLFPWGAGGRSTCADGSAYTSVPIFDPRALPMPRPTDPNDIFRYIYWLKKMKCLVAVHDPRTGAIIWANPYAETVYGGPLRDRNISDILDPFFLGLVKFRLRAMIRDGYRPGDIMIKYRDINGVGLWLKTTSTIAFWRGELCIMTIAENETPEWELYSYIYGLIRNILSDREWEYMRLAAHGYEHPHEIAQRMNIYRPNAYEYRERIFRKFNFNEASYREALYYIFFYDFFFQPD